MAKVFFVTLLLHAPIILMIGGFCFLLARWSLRRQVFNKLIKAMLLLCLIAFAIGMVYGIMRFSGLIIFADDNFNSYNWFDRSYRDSGFRYIYCCGSVLAGIITAFLIESIDRKENQERDELLKTERKGFSIYSGGYTMNKLRKENINHFIEAGAFLLISAIVIWTFVLITSKTEIEHERQTETQQIEFTDASKEANPNVPEEVLGEVVRIAKAELEYIQQKFPEKSYTQNKIQQVHHVHTCEDVEGEIFEVYAVDCLYRRDETNNWEKSELGPKSYLIFRKTAGGRLQWLGDFHEFNDPGTVIFTDHLHARLMDLDDTFLYKLQANASLEIALEHTLTERMMRIVPGEYSTFEWKLLDTVASGSSGTAYGLLLFYSHSGSPLIYSEKAGQYTAAIYSSYLLPVAVSYQQDQSARYVVTDVWEPSQTNYEEDVRSCFPKEAAEDILQNLNTYAVVSLEADGYAPDAAEIEVFSEGPIWPTYYFHEELDDGTLCGLADDYGDRDIYTKPVRNELYRRFFQNPQRLLNALGDCAQDEQNTICKLLSEQSTDSRFPRDGVEGLTQNAQKCYAEILNKAGISQNVSCTYLMNDGTDIYITRMIDLFEDVLFRNGEFTQVTSTSSGEVSLSELYKEGTELEMLKGHRQFAIIDLDDDGTAEVVLPLAVGDRQTPYGFEILHYHDNKIQGYTMMYREFCGLKTDGTFVVSGGANDWAICSVDSFSQECCNVTKHLWCKSSENDNGIFSVEYFWEGETVGEDIFLGRATNWEQMDEVVFHEFSAWDEIVY